MIELLEQLVAGLTLLSASLSPVLGAVPQLPNIQVVFTKEQGSLSFTDALWFTPEEYALQTSSTIDALETERFDNWLAVINATSTDE